MGQERHLAGILTSPRNGTGGNEVSGWVSHARFWSVEIMGCEYLGGEDSDSKSDRILAMLSVTQRVLSDSSQRIAGA